MIRAALPIAAAALLLGGTAPARAAGKHAGPKPFQWNRFAPKGLGISVVKPTTLTLKKKTTRHGYLRYEGIEKITKTRFALFVIKSGRTADQLHKDVPRLTGIPTDKWLPVLALGATRGFAYLQAVISRHKPGTGSSVLLARHQKRALSYVLLVEAQMGVAVTYAAAFKKAFLGLKAIP
ncbi:MAG: hypothetical protein ABI333_02730 [bacterium]